MQRPFCKKRFSVPKNSQSNLETSYFFFDSIRHCLKIIKIFRNQNSLLKLNFNTLFKIFVVVVVKNNHFFTHSTDIYITMSPKKVSAHKTYFNFIPKKCRLFVFFAFVNRQFLVIYLKLQTQNTYKIKPK
jgi:hypothetical protein